MRSEGIGEGSSRIRTHNLTFFTIWSQKSISTMYRYNLQHLLNICWIVWPLDMNTGEASPLALITFRSVVSNTYMFYTYCGLGVSLCPRLSVSHFSAFCMQYRKLLLRYQYNTGLIALWACPNQSENGKIWTFLYCGLMSNFSEQMLYGSQHIIKTPIKTINIRATRFRPSITVELLSEVLRWNSSEHKVRPIIM